MSRPGGIGGSSAALSGFDPAVHGRAERTEACRRDESPWGMADAKIGKSQERPGANGLEGSTGEGLETGATLEIGERTVPWWDYFRRFRRQANPLSPTKPDPSKSRVPGSGTGVVPLGSRRTEVGTMPLVPAGASDL